MKNNFKKRRFPENDRGHLNVKRRRSFKIIFGEVPVSSFGTDLIFLTLYLLWHYLLLIKLRQLSRKPAEMWTVMFTL